MTSVNFTLVTVESGLNKVNNYSAALENGARLNAIVSLEAEGMGEEEERKRRGRGGEEERKRRGRGGEETGEHWEMFIFLILKIYGNSEKSQHLSPSQAKPPTTWQTPSSYLSQYKTGHFTTSEIR